MEAAKSKIHDQDLPMHLWVEVTRTTVYVHNIIAHSALGNKTLEDMFTGEMYEVIHLKIFGCPMYLHFPKEKRSKLTLEERMKYLLDTVTSQKLIDSTSQVSIRLRLAEMSHLMKMQLSPNPKIIMYMNIIKKRRRLLELHKLPDH